MSSPSFDRAQELFLKAREIPADKRGAFLAQHGGADAKVRAEVEALLEAEDASPGIVGSLKALGFGPKRDGAAIAPATQTEDVPSSLLLQDDPRQIDNYQILQRIGEGGLGTVYLAEQREPVVRRVALKVIKLGMDTRQVVARFEQERQALAMMDHPNIAKVLDAGADQSGRPYFVMELVRGDAITKYCDTNKLSTRERLGLFVDVCHAVQHAHQKGIIHRDIKPSNVLVTMQDGNPIPKVIDFGIAKATNARLTEKTLFTERGQIIGTLEYMSPEQAEMSSVDVDTRSDIYSLGVLLYELLTGTTPFEPKQLREGGYVEIQRIIREVEPPKPSTRLSSMKEGLPRVATQRHTEPSRLTSLVRGDLDWITMKCLEKQRARRYETANGLALDLLRHLTGEAVVAAPPSAVYRMRKILRRNRGPVAAMAAVFLALLLGLAGTLWKAEDARREAANANAESEKSRAVQSFLTDSLRAAVPGRGRPSDYRLRDWLDAVAKRMKGESLQDQPRVRAGLEALLSRCYNSLADYWTSYLHAKRALGVLQNEGIEDLETQTHALVSIGESIIGLRDSGQASTDLVNEGLVALGEAIRILKQDGGKRAVSIQAYEGSVAYLQQHEQTQLWPDSAVTYIASVWGRKDLEGVRKELDDRFWRITRAWEAGERQTATKIIRDGCLNLGTELGRSLAAIFVERMGLEAHRKRAYSFAEASYTAAVELIANDKNLINRRLGIQLHRASLQCEMRRWEEARALLEAILPDLSRVLGPLHQETTRAERLLAETLERHGQIEEALAKLETLSKATIEKLGEDSLELVPTLRAKAGILERAGRLDEAVSGLRKAIDLPQGANHAEKVERLRLLVDLGRCLARTRQYEAAEARLREAWTEMRDLVPPPGRLAEECKQVFVELYESWGRPDEAELYR